MKVLLTGSTGFVGAALLRALNDEGASARCVLRAGTVDRLPPGSNEIIETQDLFTQPVGWWAEICDGVDLVLHAAWYAEPGHYLTSQRNLDCLSGTLNLARGAALAGVKRFVGLGTCFEYDLSVGHLSIDTKLAPETLYSACKLSTYTALDAYFPGQGVSFLWARLFYLFGADENPKRLVPYLHQQLSAGKRADLTSGQQIRDYMDVDVAARMILSDACSERTGATNICTEIGRTVADIATEIADEYGRRDLLNFGARPDNLSDPPIVVGIRPV